MGKIRDLLKELAHEVTGTVMARVTQRKELTDLLSKSQAEHLPRIRRIQELEVLVDKFKSESNKWKQVALAPLVTVGDLEEHHRHLQRRIPVMMYLGPFLVIRCDAAKTAEDPAAYAVRDKKAFELLGGNGWDVIRPQDTDSTEEE